jgi:phosphoribosyl 1,2-cyclic phosphodiesterase
MKIRFWGTRGSIAAPGRDTILYGGNTTCLEIRFENGRTVIVDAGTGIRRLGNDLRERKGPDPAVLLVTHVHWDHIIGFPFFATSLDPGSELVVDGHPNAMMGLRHTFDTPMGGGYFPVAMENLEIRIRHTNRIALRPMELGGVSVDSVPVRHPQGGVGFRFREADRTMVFLTDNELSGEEAIEAYVPFCEGADLLVHDAQYAPEEMPGRRGWGHSDYGAALELAHRAGVSRLVLFHHDPARTDAELEAFELLCRNMIKDRGWDLAVEAAREDGEIHLK